MDSGSHRSSMGGKYQHGASEPSRFSADSVLVKVGSEPSRFSADSVLGKVGSEPDVDALLANAGYTVKASDLAHVAQRLEQLETVLCAAQEAGISHLSSEAVHYNPSDLAGWVECMIEELAPSLGEPPPRRGEFGAVGSSCLDSPLERGSFVGDGNTQQGSGSGSSMEAGSHFKDGSAQEGGRAVGTGPPRYVVKDFPGMTLLEELEDFQYKGGSEDQVSSNHMGDFYSGIQAAEPRAVFPEGLDIPQGGILPGGVPLQHRVYPGQPDPVLHPRHHQLHLNKSGFRPTPFSHGILPFQEHSRHQPCDHGSRFSGVQTAHHRRFPNGLYAQQPVMYADVEEGAQESGIRLVHLLLACAEAVQGNELAAADEMVREIRRLASPHSGAMGKVAAHFVEALARRIYGINSPDWLGCQADALSELLYFQFYETCPYLKFAHFTANQAILEAFEGHKFVHVIDFNLMQGLQWPALIQALALRPGGPPHLRLTGIGPPQPDGKDVLQEIGMKLAQLADSVNVEFDFRGVVATKLDDVKPWMLQVRQGEAVAVNSILQLHRLLYSENSSPPPIDEVLQSVRSLNPRIITVVEQEANHNSPFFLDRFMQALHHYSTMFDSLEACSLPPQSSEMVLTEMYLGREVVNIVACEGASRLERHETLCQWRIRMSSAAFRPLHLGSNAFKQASMLLTLFSGEGYTVEENNGCLTLGWHSRPLIAASAWQCGG